MNKQIKINKFNGLDRRPSADDDTFYTYQNFRTDKYPSAFFGLYAAECSKQCTYTTIAQVWPSAYGGFATSTPSAIPCDMVYVYNKSPFISLSYADASTPLCTKEYPLNLNYQICKAGRMYYDLTNKRVFYTAKENNKVVLNDKSLTDSITWSSQILLDNTTAGVVTITLWDARKAPYFEENDNITLSCDDWSNNSTGEDASCFATHETSETDNKGFAISYVVTSVSTSVQSSGAYKHVYTCSVTGGGGKPFESSFTQVYFGKYSSSKTYASITFGKRFPNFIDICYFKNRYAGVTSDGAMLMLSAQGDYQQFYDYSGEETDSYYMSFQTGSPFVGLTEFDDTLVLFKRDCIHVVSGDYPTNYQLAKTINGVGCIDKNSICVCNGCLYFLSSDGLCYYYGGSVVKLDNVLDEQITACKTVATSHKLYFQVTTASGSFMLIFNTINGVWEIFSGGGSYKGFYCLNDIFYCTNGTKLYYHAEGGGPAMMQSRDIHADFYGKKSLLRFRLRAYVYSGYITLNIMRNSGEWELIKKDTTPGYIEWDLTIRNITFDTFKYQLYCSGVGRIDEIILDMRGLDDDISRRN